VNQCRAARVGKQLAPQADQPARRNFKIHTHSPGIVIAHLEHFAAAAAQGFKNDADKILGHVDDQALERLELAAIFRAHDDLRLADHQLEALASHGLD
jgi:hypothetical protein